MDLRVKLRRTILFILTVFWGFSCENVLKNGRFTPEEVRHPQEETVREEKELSKTIPQNVIVTSGKVPAGNFTNCLLSNMHSKDFLALKVIVSSEDTFQFVGSKEAAEQLVLAKCKLVWSELQNHDRAVGYHSVTLLKISRNEPLHRRPKEDSTVAVELPSGTLLVALTKDETDSLPDEWIRVFANHKLGNKWLRKSATEQLDVDWCVPRSKLHKSHLLTERLLDEDVHNNMNLVLVGDGMIIGYFTTTNELLSEIAVYEIFEERCYGRKVASYATWKALESIEVTDEPDLTIRPRWKRQSGVAGVQPRSLWDPTLKKDALSGKLRGAFDSDALEEAHDSKRIIQKIRGLKGNIFDVETQQCADAANQLGVPIRSIGRTIGGIYSKSSSSSMHCVQIPNEERRTCVFGAYNGDKEWTLLFTFDIVDSKIETKSAECTWL